MATDLQKVAALAVEPHYRGLPQDCNGLGEAVEPNCGDRLIIGLRVNERQMVAAAGYDLTETACPTLFACAAAAVALSLDKPVLAGYTVGQEQIGALLSDNGELDQEHRHCAMMAELSLKRAVVSYAQSSQNNRTEGAVT